MSIYSDTNPPAFPRSYGHDGMTLRDWFAGQALAGLTGNAYVAEQTIRLPSTEVDEGVAREAYAFADAMLAARAEHGK